MKAWARSQGEGAKKILALSFLLASSFSCYQTRHSGTLDVAGTYLSGRVAAVGVLGRSI